MRLVGPAAMDRLGRTIADVLQPGDTVALSGGLGAGKTSLARGILAGLGHRGEVPSPSFAILEYYDPPQLRLPLIHADFYRIEDPVELAELGLDRSAGEGLIAEWPERVGGLAGPATLELQIAMPDASARDIVARPGSAWQARWEDIVERICKPIA